MLGISALGVMAANAAAPGVYVTGQLGYAKDKTKLTALSPNAKAYNPSSITLSNNGLAGRLAIGYQFNQNFAVEMGYLQLSKKNLNGTLFTPARGFVGPVLKGSASLQQNAIDILGKGILPVSDKFNVYGKLGVAYLTSTVKGKYDVAGKSIDLNNNTANIAKHKWAPEAAVGVSYDITPNVSVDTSWTHIQPLGNKRPGNIDFVAVGVAYNFG
ncbi:MAG: outer membrane beta-barrel protein [Rickettsiella sp.]|nr:outer membrane beta-barrel protein [Rickettsiella sp.]